MNGLESRLVGARREAGLTQAALAAAAGVSLATVQSVEAGRANPSLGTLRSLLGPLGLEIALREVPADWDRLAALGLPLAAAEPAPAPATAAELARQFHLGARELERDASAPDAERKRECLRALLLAVRNHFPSVYRAWFRRSGPVRRLPGPPSGREIKLARIARARLAEYL